jgi:hypothetical protein
MVFHPDSEVAQQREKEEADEFKTQPKRISQDARVTLETLSAIRSGLPAADQPFLEVRAVSETICTVQSFA